MSGNVFDIDAEDLRPTYTLDKPIIFDRKPLKSRKPRSNAPKSPFKAPPIKKSPSIASRKSPKISVIVESQLQNQQQNCNPPSPLLQYNDSAYDSSCSSIECAIPVCDNSQNAISSDTNSSGVFSIDTPAFNKPQPKLSQIHETKNRQVTAVSTITVPSTNVVADGIDANKAKKGTINVLGNIEKVAKSNSSIPNNAIKQRGRKKHFTTPEELPTTDSSTSSSSSSSSSSSDLSDASASETEDTNNKRNNNGRSTSFDKLNEKNLTVPASVKRIRKTVGSTSRNFRSDNDYGNDDDQVLNGINNDVLIAGTNNSLTVKHKKNVILNKSKTHLKKPIIKRKIKRVKPSLVQCLSSTMAPKSTHTTTITEASNNCQKLTKPLNEPQQQQALKKHHVLSKSLFSSSNTYNANHTTPETATFKNSNSNIKNNDKLTRKCCKTTKLVDHHGKLQKIDRGAFTVLDDSDAISDDDNNNDDDEDDSNDYDVSVDKDEVYNNDSCDDQDLYVYDSDEATSMQVPNMKKIQQLKLLKTKPVKSIHAINSMSSTALYNGSSKKHISNKEITLAEMLNTYNPMLPTAMRSACAETIFDSLDTSGTRNRILPLAPTAFSFAQNSRQRHQIQKLQKEVVTAQRYYEQCILYVYCDNRLDLLPKLYEENPEFVNVLRITDGNQMIRQACCNVCNYDNLLLLEWSEAILIQLCCLNQPDILSLQWFEISRTVATQQWNRILTKFLREVVAGPMMQLQLLLTQNHNWKCATYHMPDNLCFVSGRIPPVNLFVLQKVSVETKFNTITSTFIPTSILMPCNNNDDDYSSSTDEEFDSDAFKDEVNVKTKN